MGRKGDYYGQFLRLSRSHERERVEGRGSTRSRSWLQAEFGSEMAGSGHGNGDDGGLRVSLRWGGGFRCLGRQRSTGRTTWYSRTTFTDFRRTTSPPSAGNTAWRRAAGRSARRSAAGESSTPAPGRALAASSATARVPRAYPVEIVVVEAAAGVNPGDVALVGDLQEGCAAHRPARPPARGGARRRRGQNRHHPARSRLRAAWADPDWYRRCGGLQWLHDDTTGVSSNLAAQA